MAPTGVLSLVLSLMVLANASLDDRLACTAGDACSQEELPDSWLSLLQVTKRVRQVEGGKARKDAWSVHPSDFSDTMTLTALVEIDTPGTLGAFSGSEVRGVQDTPSSPPFGPYAGKDLYLITIYANSGGESISFKFMGTDGSVTELEPTTTFEVNGNVGNVVDPVKLSPVSPGGWTVQYADFSDTMTMTASVTISGVLQEVGTLAAFAGGEVRGVQDTASLVPFGTYAGKSLYLITMYANAGGETFSFKFKAADGTVTDLQQTIDFEINGNLGDVLTPFELTGGSTTSTCADAPQSKIDAAVPGMTCALGKQFMMCSTDAALMETLCAATCGFC